MPDEALEERTDHSGSRGRGPVPCRWFRLRGHRPRSLL
jgi:hypothetical protein